MGFGGSGGDGGGADSWIVEGAVLIGGTCVVSYLYDPVEQLSGRGPKLLILVVRKVLRSRDRVDEFVAVEGVQLVDHDDRDHQPVARLWWGDGAAHADDHVDVGGTRAGPDGLD